jgi:hypothetical protein
VTFDAARLFDLLPAVYRIRDVEQALQNQDGPLHALLSVIADQLAVIEEGLDQHHDDLFIETCAEWVVPYIGELVGARGIGALPGSRFSERAFVANTIRYRRRKGTASVLEQLAADVTGWPSSVVEYFERLATTQYLNHLRPGNLSFADIRDAASLEAPGTAFDRVAHTADVRRIEPLRGRYNIPHVGIFLYRLTSFSVTDAPASPLDTHRYFFDSLGRNLELYNKPEIELEITHVAEPRNVPLPIARRVLDRAKSLYIGPEKSLTVSIGGADVPSSDLIVCDLSDTATGWAHTPATKVAVDPELGRLALPSAFSPPASVRVSYHYGFSASMGGGEYEREPSFVVDEAPVRVPADRPTLQQALAAARATPAVVEVVTNDRFAEALDISAGRNTSSLIEVRAANRRRPAVVPVGDWIITGSEGSEVTLNGFLFGAGRLRLPAVDALGNPNELRLLRIRHCTLLPVPRPPVFDLPADAGGARIVVEIPNVIVDIDASIVGAIRAVEGAHVRIRNSIVDAGSEADPACGGIGIGDPGAELRIESSTVIGTVRTSVMTLASNTIFLSSAPAGEAPVSAERLQQGCVRFSFVPPGSRVPRRHRCQPASPEDAGRVRPVFVSLTCGAAGYAQLARPTASEIRLGADDGAEMGAFHDLFQPQRIAGLRASLDEYLRFGLEAGIFLAS